MENGFGILALIPPIIAIAMALITKKTIISLSIGVLSGVIIINGWNPLTAIPTMIGDFVIPQIANGWNAGMLMLIFGLSMFVYSIKISGASKALGDLATKKIKTRKQALNITFFSAFAFIYTEPTLTLGTIMRPVTEKFNVSRVKLAYLCDVMGSPFATLSPITAYSIYATGLIATQFTALNITDNAWDVYLKGIPFNFYAIFGIITLFYVIQTSLDIGPMYTAEKRAIETGQLIGENDKPMERYDDSENAIMEGKAIGIENFIVPITLLFITLFGVIFWTGNIVDNGLFGSMREANIILSITTGFIVGSIAAGIMGARSSLYEYSKIVDNFVKGVMLNTEIPIILILAWSLGGVTETMQLKDYVVTVIDAISLSPALLPAIIFVLGAFIAFSTGSSFGVWAIMMPIAIPIAHRYNIPMGLVIGAVLSGGVLGDHCSPISDTTILASTAAGADHIEHVRTQLPYALLVGGSSMIGFIFGGFINPWVGFIATALAIVIGLSIFNKISVKKEAKLIS